MTRLTTRSPTFSQNSVNRFTYLYAITSLAALAIVPLIGWWIAGPMAAIATVVLVLAGILLTRGLFMTTEHSWVRVASLCLATVTVSAVGFFSILPLIVKTLEQWQVSAECVTATTWICSLPVLSAPSRIEQWALFLIVVLFSAGLAWLAYKRSTLGAEVSDVSSDTTLTPRAAVSKLESEQALNTDERDALGNGIRTGEVVFNESSATDAQKKPITIGIGSRTFEALAHTWLQSEAKQFWSAPTPPRDFVGRDRQLKDLIVPIVTGDPGTICTIHGMGGIGKTTLAALVAQKAASAFPDGIIWLDLRGIRQQFSLSSDEALARVIRRLDRVVMVPDNSDDRVALFRAVLARRKCLIIADDAKDSAHVKPLTPPGRSVLLVTSRKQLTLDGAVSIDVPLLEKSDALALLNTMISARSQSIAQAHQEKIVDLCGKLPLAIRAAGAFLAENADWSGVDYISSLQQRSERFDALASDDVERDVRLVLGFSHDRLLEESAMKAQRWRFLSVVPSHFDVPAAAAIWACSLEEAKQTLSELTRLAMLEFDPATKKYRFHDLMRDLAEEQFEKRETAAT